MDFTAQIKALAERTPSMLESIQTEEATKQYLIIPFVEALGYDVRDPKEVVPEFDANIGGAKKFKLDYAIFKDGKPIILIECKCRKDKLEKDDAYTQLFTYYAAVDARIGVLTNGVIYRFYADLERPNKMDRQPFLEIDMCNLRESLIDELRKITKSAFNVDEMIFAAMELKYIGGILGILTEQMDEPSDDLTEVFFRKLCPGRVFSANAKSQFSDYMKRALKQFVRDQISSILDASGFIGSSAIPVTADPSTSSSSEDITTTKLESKIVTTDEEIEGYHIVKSILRGVIDSKRIIQRDSQSYCSVLLDDNNRRPICRLYFNNPNSKKVGLFDHGNEDKQEERFSINSLDDIYQYSEKLKSTVLH